MREHTFGLFHKMLFITLDKVKDIMELEQKLDFFQSRLHLERDSINILQILIKCVLILESVSITFVSPCLTLPF